MLHRYILNGEEIDSIDLKVLLVTKGINIPSDEIFKRFGETNRLSSFKDPQSCNCLLLPDNTVVHITDIGPQSPFSMAIDEDGVVSIEYEGEFVTEVQFPPQTEFYEQHTSNGIPFKDMAVLQGLDVLSFPYLWPCEFAQAGYACQFCHKGGYTEELFREKQPESPFPTPRDVAEVVNYAVNTEDLASFVQITGGSTINPRAECHLITEMLNAIDEVAGLRNISDEILVYTTPPDEPHDIDKVFEKGADRVACDIEVWNEELFKQICPGKDRFIGRERQLKTLLHISEKYGRNKACSAFVVGLEPVESFLSGAEYLASHGIVPIASIWIPHGRPVLGLDQAPGLSYYRQLRDGLAMIYDKYECEPPGRIGFNVCLCRDAWNHKAEILKTRAPMQ